MFRRDLLAAAAVVALPRFAIAQPAAARTLRYVPHANLPNIDPFTNTAFIARDHAFLVFDQLYGMNDKFDIVLQMVQGHVVENDGLLWRFTLREGLKFHDGTPVRGRDCIASIKRWGRRDAFGQAVGAERQDAWWHRSLRRRRQDGRGGGRRGAAVSAAAGGQQGERAGTHTTREAGGDGEEYTASVGSE